MALVEITSKEQFSELTSVKDKLIALYFHTPWASPCFQMNKVISTLAESPQYESTTFLSINADNFPEVSDLFDITAVPYFVLVKNGTILKELSGADPKEFVNTLDTFSTSQGAKTQSDSVQERSTVAAPQEETPEQLNDRLKKLTTAAPIMLFMKGTPSAPQCGFSRQMVAILREHQVRFGFFDILKDDSVRQGLKAFSDWPTFPQLYISGEFQGGLDIIKENLSEDAQFFEHAVEGAN
ncbi:monothiol glutaredoxin [Martiniozyma asiatica (nom. inval.)]|nr:monothiol glutaredoxin [Martiniozyma asiatica]